MALEMTTSYICEICKLEYKTYSAFIQHVRLGCSDLHKVKWKDMSKLPNESIPSQMCEANFESYSSIRKHPNHSCLPKYMLNDESKIKSKAQGYNKVRCKAVEIYWKLVSCHAQKRTETRQNKTLLDQQENSNNVETEKNEPTNRHFDCLACGKKCDSDFDLKCHMIVHQANEKMGSQSQSFYLKKPTADQKNTIEKVQSVRSKIWDSDDVTADVLSHDVDFKDLTTFSVKARVKEFLGSKGPAMKKIYVCKEIKTVQFKPKFLRCKVCQKVVRATGFKDHKATHFGETRFQCTVCKKAFKMRAYLRSHMHLHSKENNFECGLCGQKFKTASHLWEHKQKVHISEKRHLCDVCGKLFLSHTCFRTHMQIHVRDRQKYLCDVCGNSFTALSTLTVHKLIHSGTKPFKCSICGHGFAHKPNLERHFRVHTGEKPYQCNICGKSLTDAKSLKFHLNVHTGEKPYKCDVCSRGFAAKSNLRQHRKNH